MVEVSVCVSLYFMNLVQKRVEVYDRGTKLSVGVVVDLTSSGVQPAPTFEVGSRRNKS
jgi:hypothetical protein